ncbi:unnamed protein product [Closterium sp. Naga37s-1]|nr:unnamed protein product [Closterium sp. Naga37s-1]
MWLAFDPSSSAATPAALRQQCYVLSTTLITLSRSSPLSLPRLSYVPFDFHHDYVPYDFHHECRVTKYHHQQQLAPDQTPPFSIPLFLPVALLGTPLPPAPLPLTPAIYVPFDFHHECGATKYHQLSVLDDQIGKDMETQGFFLQGKDGFFLQGKDGSVQKQQQGTVRTNCVDCLDRTNVTQVGPQVPLRCLSGDQQHDTVRTNCVDCLDRTIVTQVGSQVPQVAAARHSAHFNFLIALLRWALRCRPGGLSGGAQVGSQVASRSLSWFVRHVQGDELRHMGLHGDPLVRAARAGGRAEANGAAGMGLNRPSFTSHPLGSPFPTWPSLPHLALPSPLGPPFPTWPSLPHLALPSPLRPPFPTSPSLPHLALL